MPTPPADPVSPWLLVGIIVGFPFVFVGIWSFVCVLLSSLGGWGRLAARYRTREAPAGTAFYSQYARLGLTSYKATMNFHLTPRGFYMTVMPLFRPGHPPLFIPWEDVYNAQPEKFLWIESMRVDLGSPALATLRMPAKVYAARPAAGA